MAAAFNSILLNVFLSCLNNQYFISFGNKVFYKAISIKSDTEIYGNKTCFLTRAQRIPSEVATIVAALQRENGLMGTLAVTHPQKLLS